MDSTVNIIQVRDLSISFGSNHVLQNVNLDLKENENLVVLGKSGSGKSVLIKCIIGLLKADEGSIELFGEKSEDLDEASLNRLRARIGFLFQSNALYDSMSIRENMEFQLERSSKGFQVSEMDSLILQALNDVQLPQTINMMPAELSGGMRKRIALARALILKPEIVMYDEPTTGLDPITSREIIDLMIRMRSKYRTASIIITHDMYCVRKTANRIILLWDGKKYWEGTLAEFELEKDPIILSFKQ
jgi:phospholipid/cholesterol/gamma-HCH transport system ATP-binding protein